MLSDPEIPVKEKAASDQKRTVTFRNLIPGRLYNITLLTVSGGVTSRPQERQERLHPQPVSYINATSITFQEITLVWNEPKGDFDAFEVLYQDDQDRVIQNYTETNSIIIGGLKAYRNYTFTVRTKSGNDQSVPRTSTPYSANYTTQENVPGSVSSFEPIDVKPSQITFSWRLPQREANGIITGYTIHWGLKPDKGKNFLPEESRRFDPTETQGTITDLVPGLKYTFQIHASTKVGNGKWTVKEQKMPILPPPPAKSVFPTEVSRSMHTITVRFRKNYFSNVNGKVLGYSILVAEDYTIPTENDAFLHSWGYVQQFSSWPPFQVSNKGKEKAPG